MRYIRLRDARQCERSAMMFDFNTKSSVLLVFFAHGLVFAALLLAKARSGQRSAGWLSLFLLLCSLYVVPFMCGYANWYAHDGYRETLFYLPLQQVLLLGPVMYCYTRQLLNPSFRLSGKAWLHFLPALLYLLYALVIVVVDELVLDEPWFYSDGRDKDLKPWYQVVGLISMLTYFGMSLHVYRNYQRMAYRVLSFAEEVQHRWVQRFLVVFLAFLVLRIVFFIVQPEWGDFGRKFWYYVCFSVLFYYLAITGYFHTLRTTLRGPLAQHDSPGALMYENVQALEADSEAGDPVEKALPEVEAWKPGLEKLMLEDHLYRNPSLTLMDVADRLSTTPRQVSQLVNQGYAVNFNDFVNHHRAQAVMRLIREEKHKAQTLLSLAHDCGFNSKSTFNRAFKKSTGLTPKEFVQQVAERGAKS
ncbi:MAG: AraC family transcriptional regulator [Bacteroidota bacterium]